MYYKSRRWSVQYSGGVQFVGHVRHSNVVGGCILGVYIGGAYRYNICIL